jgi:hypothetical protein
MGNEPGGKSSTPRRPSGSTRRELQKHVAEQAPVVLTNEQVLAAFGLQVVDPRGPVEPLDLLLGKFAEDYFEQLFRPEAGDWQRQVKVYTSDPGQLQHEPLRIDRVRVLPNGDELVEIKPDTPASVSVGERKVRKVYKPLREKGTGRPVARAHVKTYSKEEVFLTALKIGYIDLKSQYTLNRLPRRWRTYLRRVIASRPKAAGTPATPLGMPTVTAGGRKRTPPPGTPPEGAPTGAAPQRPPLKRGTERREPVRGTPELVPDAVRRGGRRRIGKPPGGLPRPGGGGGAAAAEVAVQLLNKGYELGNDWIIALDRERMEPFIREYRKRGKFVAVWADYELIDTKDVVRGVDPKPDEIARGVHLTVGDSEEEALGRQPPAIGKAGRIPKSARRPRRDADMREELLAVLPPLEAKPSDPSIFGPYRIVSADARARRANPLVLARTLYLDDGNVERFTVTFGSTDARYGGMVTQPGYNRFFAVFVPFPRKDAERRSWRLPENWHYGIASEMSAYAANGGQVFLLERFKFMRRGGREQDRGTIIWQRR